MTPVVIMKTNTHFILFTAPKGEFMGIEDDLFDYHCNKKTETANYLRDCLLLIYRRLLKEQMQVFASYEINIE